MNTREKRIWLVLDDVGDRYSVEATSAAEAAEMVCADLNLQADEIVAVLISRAADAPATVVGFDPMAANWREGPRLAGIIFGDADAIDRALVADGPFPPNR